MLFLLYEKGLSNIIKIEANSNIERNINKFSDGDRRFLSQNLLNVLRTFVEYIAVKICLTGKTEIINYDNRTVRIALDDIKCRGNVKFIERFHYYLQISRSHYVENDDSALFKVSIKVS